MEKFKRAGRIALSAGVLSLISYMTEAQVGIGTTTPQEKLHVHDGSLLITTPELPAEKDPFYDPAIPTPMQYGLSWIHSKSAFRSVGERVGTGALNPHYSFAYGFSSSATGHSSVAIGQQVSTNGKTGSFVFGDNSPSSTKNDAGNQMMMRFAGGYKLFSNSAGSIGVQVLAGGNSWQVLSDVNKKENFAPVNGEDFLQKISKMPLTSWNYKGQDPKTFRHYGPMAQDFYKAFGQDAYGTIGTDTTINQADFDGINLIAIQALVRRMEQMNSDLLAEIATIKAQLADAQSALRRKNRRELVSKK